MTAISAPKLRALSEDNADVVNIALAISKWVVVQDLNITTGGLENPRQHLNAGGFPRTVGADVADKLSPLDTKGGNLIDSDKLSILSVEQVFDAPKNSLPPIEGLKGLGKLSNFNNRHR